MSIHRQEEEQQSSTPRVAKTQTNGSPGPRTDIGGDVDAAVSVAVEDGRITRMYAIGNPDELAGVNGEAALPRS